MTPSTACGEREQHGFCTCCLLLACSQPCICIRTSRHCHVFIDKTCLILDPMSSPPELTTHHRRGLKVCHTSLQPLVCGLSEMWQKPGLGWACLSSLVSCEASLVTPPLQVFIDPVNSWPTMKVSVGKPPLVTVNASSGESFAGHLQYVEQLVRHENAYWLSRELWPAGIHRCSAGPSSSHWTAGQTRELSPEQQCGLPCR